MAQKRLHFLRILLLSIPWIALYARCVEAFDCSSSEHWDEICIEGDDLLSAWIPHLNCSVPNEITLRYTDERNHTVSDFGDVLLSVEELRLECHNNDSWAVCIHSGFDEAAVLGGTYTFSNLNETGIFPRWTCMVKGCFTAEDAYLFYRTPPVSCTLSPAICSPECLHGTCIGLQECDCDPGYTGSHCSINITVCEDTNNGGCEHNCTNINGSFICSCRDGFTLSADQRSCDDETRTPTSVAATMTTGEDNTSNISSTDDVPHISKAPKMSDSDIFAIWPFIWGGSAGGGFLLLLILVASFFIVLYLIQQKKGRAKKSRCNTSTEVAYSTTKRSDSRVNPDSYSNDHENVPAHTKLNADNKSSEPVLDVVYPVPNFEEHQFPASATHTNAAYASSKSPLAAELEPVYI